MKTELSGPVRAWTLGGVEREYINVTLPYAVARKVFRPDTYSAVTGKGEQREVVAYHVRMLRKEMEAGTFTPTPVHVGLRSKHRKVLGWSVEGEIRLVTLVIEEPDTLPLTNGGHRFEALDKIRQDAEKYFRGARTDEDREEARQLLEEVEAQPIDACILLNGNTQEDFLNLQKGKNVDSTHMLSLKIQTKVVPEKDQPYYDLARSVARMMLSNSREVVPGVIQPFFRQLRFDTSGPSHFPFSTLCGRGTSDQASSLLGLARVGLSAAEPRTAEWLFVTLMWSIRALIEHAPELLEEGRLLQLPPHGPKGAGCILIGLAVLMAYRQLAIGEEPPSAHCRTQLAAAAHLTLDLSAKTNLSAPSKRELLGKFAREFFLDLDVDKHAGLPVGLLKVLSPSAYASPPLPKEPKQPKPKTDKKKDKGKRKKGVLAAPA